MKRLSIIGVACVLLLVGLLGCAGGPSEKERAKISALQAELKQVEEQAKSADAAAAGQDAGLAKNLAANRAEILKTTAALIKQRVQALESGASITTTVSATAPDAKLAASLEGEIKRQETELDKARDDAAAAEGLLGSVKQTTAAYIEQTLAVLRGRYLAAKYGLPVYSGMTVGSAPSSEAPGASGADASEDVASQIIKSQILRKKVIKGDYQDFMAFDIKMVASGLDKPARSIKGTLHFEDLFGESKMALGWTINKPLSPGQSMTEKGLGFEINQFMDEHQWVRNAKLNDMKASYTVESIIYKDGTRIDF